MTASLFRFSVPPPPRPLSYTLSCLLDVGAANVEAALEIWAQMAQDFEADDDLGRRKLGLDGLPPMARRVARGRPWNYLKVC
jgi:hypothetical protein